MLYFIHFPAIEDYPPTRNFLNIFSNLNYDLHIKCFTINSTLKAKKIAESKSIKIHRYSNPAKFKLRLYRFYLILNFHLKVFINLLKDKPSKIIYYETLSSLAPIIYCVVKRWKIDLYIHYHEYTTPLEYKNGMLLANFFHWVEKKIYNKVKWISLTNEYRIKKFLNDNPNIDNSIMHSLPNFPPKVWADNVSPKERFFHPIRIVFVGSLSNETMFYKEFASWVLSKKGELIWDIYSQQISEDVKEHIENSGQSLINFKGFVDYSNLNKYLVNYDIGVILYRGHIDNFIYNATNKLFEYLACGLDVWFPEELLGAYDYITDGTYPKVLKIDFKNLDKYNLEELISHEGLKYKPSQYFAEDVYEPFIKNYLLK